MTQYIVVPETLDSAVVESLRDVKEPGDANPQKFDWDVSIYNLHKPTVDGAGRVMAFPETNDPSTDQPQGDGHISPAGDDLPHDPDVEPLNWDVESLNAFALLASSSAPLLVGKVVEVTVGEEGEDILLDGFSPKKNSLKRSEYRSGGGRRTFSRTKPALALPYKARSSSGRVCDFPRGFSC